MAMECVQQLEGQPTAPALVAAVECARAVTGAAGFTPPSWRALARGARPPLWDVLEFEPGRHKRGWQHDPASRVDLRFRDEDLFHRVPAPVRALIRSQGCPMASMALSTSPTSHLTRLQPNLFRTILLRRLRQPLPLSERSCRCGRPLDSSGHHRAACAQAGVLGRRGFAVESVAARICRGAGGRVSTCSSETWTLSCQTPTMAADWRSWLTVCLCSEDANWPSTQPLSEPSMLMGQHAWERQTGMEWHSWRRDGAKKRPI